MMGEARAPMTQLRSRTARSEVLFSSIRVPTSAPIPDATTANILFRKSRLDTIPGPLEPRCPLSGGSDRFLTMQLGRKGARMIWCDEAVVINFILKSRMNLRWVLQRAYRVGNARPWFERALDPGVRRRSPRGLLGGISCIIRNLILPPPSILLGRCLAVRRLHRIAAGVGTVLGVLGHKYEECHRVHGS